MTESNTILYEGLFLFNIQEIEGDVNVALEALKEILDRAEAEALTLSKWDERKMAYEIKGQKRGLYLLTHFKARPSQIANIERDVNLSEQLLRCLIVKGDHIGETEMEQYKADAARSADEQALRGEASDSEAPATPAPAETPAPAAEVAVEATETPAESAE